VGSPPKSKPKRVPVLAGKIRRGEYMDFMELPLSFARWVTTGDEGKRAACHCPGRQLTTELGQAENLQCCDLDQVLILYVGTIVVIEWWRTRRGFILYVGTIVVKDLARCDNMAAVAIINTETSKETKATLLRRCQVQHTGMGSACKGCGE